MPKFNHGAKAGSQKQFMSTCHRSYRSRIKKDIKAGKEVLPDFKAYCNLYDSPKD